MAPSKDKPARSPNELDKIFFADHEDEDVNNIVKVKEETEKASPLIVASVLNIHDKEEDYSKEDEVADYLRAIGDKYNEQILAAYEQLRKAPCNNRFEQFKRIAHRIIENGINWGRISVILMLGTMLLKFQGQHLAESLLKFLLDFISKRLFSWIVDSGGWKSAIDYANELYNHPSAAPLFAVFVLLTAVGLIHKMLQS